MYILSAKGDIVNLDNKDIYINEYSLEYSEHFKHKAAVYASTGHGESDTGYELYFGTLAECRKYMRQLVLWLKPIEIEVSSAQRLTGEELDEMYPHG